MAKIKNVNYLTDRDRQRLASAPYAVLQEDGTLPDEQIPGQVTDVLNYASTTEFPEPGDVGKYYRSDASGKTYKWDAASGEYVEVVVPTAAVTSVAGRTGAVTLDKTDVGLGNVANTGDSATPVENGTTKFTTGGAYAELAKKLDSNGQAPDFTVSTAYSVDYIVRYNGGLYRCISAVPADNVATPDADTTHWARVKLSTDMLTSIKFTAAEGALTMAEVLARLNTINAQGQHVFFDVSAISSVPQLYLVTIFIDTTANVVRVYDQVTGKIFLGPYDATATLAETLAQAVDSYVPLTVTATTLDGVTVTGQTVYLYEGDSAEAARLKQTTAYEGQPVTFTVARGFEYFVTISSTLPSHFSPSTAHGSANAATSVTLTYQDTTNITTFAGIQGFLASVEADETLATDADRIAFARAALLPEGSAAKEIADTWTATNGTTVYDNPMVVMDVKYYEDENGDSHLGAKMERKWCSHHDIQFDAAEGVECNSATETTAEAGITYYGLAAGQTSKTAANLTRLTLSEGDTIPYSDYAKIYKTAINDSSKNVLQYGYNNWKRSGVRQYLNSSAGEGSWWTADHVGDVAPSQLSSLRGYKAGCTAALLAAVKKVKVTTYTNSVTDGSAIDVTYDDFFLDSGTEVYGSVNGNEGTYDLYWKQATGLSSPANSENAGRKHYRESNHSSASYVWLRSPYRSNSNIVWYVYTSGGVSNNAASSSYAVAPACVIY